MAKGNKERQKRGQRPRFYICVGRKDKNMINERIYFHESGPQEVKKQGIWAANGTEPSEEEAVRLFNEKHGIKPEVVEGLCFDVIGAIAAPVSDRVTVTLNSKDIRYTQKVWQGKFQGYNVTAHGLISCASKTGEKFSDDELVFLTFDGDQRDEQGKKLAKPRFGGQSPVIRFAGLESPVTA